MIDLHYKARRMAQMLVGKGNAKFQIAVAQFELYLKEIYEAGYKDGRDSAFMPRGNDETAR